MSCSQILLAGDPRYFKGRVPFKYLHFLIISRLLDRKNANVSECLHNVTSVTLNFTLRFVPLAAGPKFGSSNSIDSLKGQSEMSLNGMSSGPNNAVKQFGSDFNEIKYQC